MTTQEQIVAAYLLAGRTWAEIVAEESPRPWPVPEQIPSQEDAEALIAQARALATPLPRADFLLALLSMGRTEAHVLAAIAQLPEADQAAANILFRHRASYRRDHPLVVAMAPALGLTPEQVDAAWVQAVQTLDRSVQPLDTSPAHEPERTR
jgi:thiamine pyrophosphate-dependent acetolactate synthase large subunit-like protein